MQVDVAIIGAGAAGMFCATQAASRGRKTVILDHVKTPGDKIRISGGGRCNFTNLHITPEKFLSQNPHFAKSALKRYTQWDFIDRVDTAGIAWHEKTLGQLFCDGSAKDIIAMLLHDMAEAGADLRLNTSVTKITKTDAGFALTTSAGPINATSLVIATGGKSIPKMGATGFGYDIARQFGLDIVPTRAGLVPLTFDDAWKAQMKPLAGNSVTARVSCDGASFDEGLLFTHRGLSGPSILQISSYWAEGDDITVDLANGADIIAALTDLRKTSGRMSVKNALARVLPEKLAVIIVDQTAITGNIADLTRAQLDVIANAVHHWRVRPNGSEGYRTAEVTLGGVSTDALDAKTMQARTVPGLFFIGEVVDVTGWLGGYNFQWAWSSGWVAGQNA